jgi:hypothetical protein
VYVLPPLLAVGLGALVDASAAGFFGGMTNNTSSSGLPAALREAEAEADVGDARENDAAGWGAEEAEEEEPDVAR